MLRAWAGAVRTAQLLSRRRHVLTLALPLSIPYYTDLASRLPIARPLCSFGSSVQQTWPNIHPTLLNVRPDSLQLRCLNLSALNHTTLHGTPQALTAMAAHPRSPQPKLPTSRCPPALAMTATPWAVPAPQQRATRHRRESGSVVACWALRRPSDTTRRDRCSIARLQTLEPLWEHL